MGPYCAWHAARSCFDSQNEKVINYIPYPYYDHHSNAKNPCLEATSTAMVVQLPATWWR